MFGECGFRRRGIRLARVLKEHIEKFDQYEYMVDCDDCGQPVWVKGIEGIKQQKKNVNNFLIANPSGEMCVVFNKHLNKWILIRMSEDHTQALMHTSDNIYGPYSKAHVIIDNENKDLPNNIIYAPLTHEKLFEQDGKIMNVLLSTWLPTYNPVVLRVYLK